MGPDKDVRAIARGGGLLEFVGGAVGVSHFNGDAGFLGKPVAHFLQAIIALVAVDPDQKFAFLDLGVSRGGHAKGCCNNGSGERTADKGSTIHQVFPLLVLALFLLSALTRGWPGGLNANLFIASNRTVLQFAVAGISPDFIP